MIPATPATPPTPVTDLLPFLVTLFNYIHSRRGTESTRPYRNLAEAVIDLRRLLGWDQKTLAAELHLRQPQISQLESREHAPCSYDTLCRLQVLAREHYLPKLSKFFLNLGIIRRTARQTGRPPNSSRPRADHAYVDRLYTHKD